MDEECRTVLEKWNVKEETMEVLNANGFNSILALKTMLPEDIKTLKIKPLGQARLLDNCLRELSNLHGPTEVQNGEHANVPQGQDDDPNHQVGAALQELIAREANVPGIGASSTPPPPPLPQALIHI
ncbi:unnamed protein product [Owenia fusiformis]|uniref:Uncharacterized protein n=1 Tax=Owenia fusiformis TaxID=6347 RepID=A0A8J1UTS5_OWEFU|nr:unnamed protein product [Owenia fusiformis]